MEKISFMWEIILLRDCWSQSIPIIVLKYVERSGLKQSNHKRLEAR